MPKFDCHSAFFSLLIPTLALISGCSDENASSGKSILHKSQTKVQAESKVSAALRQSIAVIEQARANADTVTTLALSSLSNSRIKIDDDGRIQCYIYLNPFDQRHIEALQNRGLRIDAMSDLTKVVQTWLPFQQIAEIEKLDFVVRIAPPDYAKPF